MSVTSPTALVPLDAAASPMPTAVRQEILAIPRPTLAETRAISVEPSGGLINLGPNLAVNPEPGLQQLLQVVQAKARLEVTVRLLNAQLFSRTNAFA